MEPITSTPPVPANFVRHDVAGAPFCIGDVVRVVALTDETAAATFLGKQGRVIYFEYSCGCGQSYPDDPMIGIESAEDTESFWKEELELVPVPEQRPGRAVEN